MAFNPLVFLLGGLALLAATLVVAFVNRRAIATENPYDTPQRELALADVAWSLRHADALYKCGHDLGRRFPQPTPERVARALHRVGLGAVEVRRSARRVELTVRAGPAAGAPRVDEPLCYFTLGLLRGALGKAVEEEACHGTGAPHCVFAMEVAPRARS